MDFLFYNTDVYSKSIMSYPIDQNISLTNPNNIVPLNPIAHSFFFMPSFRTSLGYTYKISDKILLNTDAGLSIGKILYGVSKANFTIYNPNPLFVNSQSYFDDSYTLSIILNSNIEYVLNENINLQIGLLFNPSMSFMNNSNGYQLINSYGQFNALENASSKLIIENVCFTVGLSYKIK